MKAEITITLSEEVLQAVDQLRGGDEDRSSFIERTLKSFIDQQSRKQLRNERYAEELRILNRYADGLNAEAEDALLYQVEL